VSPVATLVFQRAGLSRARYTTLRGTTRWHDAYELIREFKGAEAAADFIELWMDIADREGYVGMYGDRVRRSFGHPVGPVAILE
jgi:hypothetical protein